MYFHRIISVKTPLEFFLCSMVCHGLHRSSMLLQKRNISHKNIFKKSGRSIGPCGTPTAISNHELNWSFILTPSYAQLNNYLCFNDSIEKPYAWSFANIRSWGRQSRAQVSKAQYSFHWSNDFLQFSTMANRQSWMLYPFRKQSFMHLSKKFWNVR